MVQEADYLRLQSNLLLNHYNIPLEIERIERELSDHYGFQGSMQLLELTKRVILN